MKKFLLKRNFFFLISLIFITFFYLFPGDIVSYFLHGDPKSNISPTTNPFGSKLRTVINTGGYSLNHIVVLSYLTFMGMISYFKKKILFGFFIFIFFAIILELSHFLIPNRSFELIDLISNLIGVILVMPFVKRIKK